MYEDYFDKEEKNELKRPTRTQWLPGLGALEAIVARVKGKPSIIETNFVYSAAYHAVGIEAIRTFTPYFVNCVTNYFK